VNSILDFIDIMITVRNIAKRLEQFRPTIIENREGNKYSMSVVMANSEGADILKAYIETVDPVLIAELEALRKKLERLRDSIDWESIRWPR